MQHVCVPLFDIGFCKKKKKRQDRPRVGFLVDTSSSLIPYPCLYLVVRCRDLFCHSRGMNHCHDITIDYYRIESTGRFL